MPPGTLLLLEPESSGHDLIPAAHALGLDVHVLSARPAAPAAASSAGAAGAAGHTVVDGSPASYVRAALEYARGHRVAGVAPGFDYAVPVAARAAALLGLPGAGPASGLGDLLQDKERMHEALAAGGVPVAGGVTFDLARRTATPLAHAADRIGFPAVLKPVNGSGSLLVRRVDDAAALRRVLDEYAERGPVADVGRLVGTRLRLEPYLSGPEISVEGHVSGGAATIVAFTRKQLGPEPHFVEVGHVVQAALTPAERAAATAVTHRAVAALGLDTAVFHLELRLTARGPVVIEVGARLGGDRIHRLVRLATGFSLPEAAVRLLTGLPAPAPPPDTALRAAGIRLFTVREPARLPDPAALRARLAALPGCAEAEVSCAPEAELRPATDFRGRFGHVILTAPDHTALTAALAEADALVSAALAAPDGGTAGADPDDRPARPARPAGEAVPCAS